MRHSSAERSLDAVLHALADPTRRAILRRVARAPASVAAIAEPFRISLNSVSKHIRVLERARLVRRTRAGREHILSYSPEPISLVQEWICQQRTFWQASLESLDEVLSRTPSPKATNERKS